MSAPPNAKGASGKAPKNRKPSFPLRDTGGAIHSLQRIDSHGGKRYLVGGAKQGHYFSVGTLTETLYICEGCATAATIYEATGDGAAVAFDAGNLLPVAEAIRNAHPELEIVIAADNDQWTDGNPGVDKAMATARAVNAKIAIPAFASPQRGLYVTIFLPPSDILLSAHESPPVSSFDPSSPFCDHRVLYGVAFHSCHRARYRVAR